MQPESLDLQEAATCIQADPTVLCWCHQRPSQLTSTSALGEADDRIKGNFPSQCPQKDTVISIPCVILLAWLCGVKLGLWFSYGSLQACVWLCYSLLTSTQGAEPV